MPYVVGPRTNINVAIDWTEFDADGQATLMLSLLTRHGRATPLLWLTVDIATLKNRRNEYECQGLVRLADALPAEIKVCIVADRGFGDHKLYQVLTEELKFDYVIRFRGNIHVTAADGEMRTAAAWVGRGGRARVLRGALVTAERYQVGTVLCVQDTAMKQAWCLATSGSDETAKALMKLYGKRWGIECGFRDTKDLRFGMGMGSIHVSTPARRDRLWLLNAFVIMLLTLLGAAGEALGYDRYLKSNATKRRTHSLFRQGCMLYDLIPTMPAARLIPTWHRTMRADEVGHTGCLVDQIKVGAVRAVQPARHEPWHRCDGSRHGPPPCHSLALLLRKRRLAVEWGLLLSACRHGILLSRRCRFSGADDVRCKCR